MRRNCLASFTKREIEEQSPIWNLFQNGGVILFRKPAILNEATNNLTRNGYRVHAIDCSHCADEPSALFAIVDSLKIPRYQRIGLDGFNDLIRQIEFDGCTGVVVVLIAFNRFWQAFPKYACHILDIMANHHRSQLLVGNRLLTLAQSEDPSIDEQIGIIGGYKPIWNSAEWLRKNRDL